MTQKKKKKKKGPCGFFVSHGFPFARVPTHLPLYHFFCASFPCSTKNTPRAFCLPLWFSFRLCRRWINIFLVFRQPANYVALQIFVTFIYSPVRYLLTAFSQWVLFLFLKGVPLSPGLIDQMTSLVPFRHFLNDFLAGFYFHPIIVEKKNFYCAQYFRVHRSPKQSLLSSWKALKIDLFPGYGSSCRIIDPPFVIVQSRNF